MMRYIGKMPKFQLNTNQRKVANRHIFCCSYTWSSKRKARVISLPQSPLPTRPPTRHHLCFPQRSEPLKLILIWQPCVVFANGLSALTLSLSQKLLLLKFDSDCLTWRNEGVPKQNKQKKQIRGETIWTHYHYPSCILGLSAAREV